MYSLVPKVCPIMQSKAVLGKVQHFPVEWYKIQ